MIILVDGVPGARKTAYCVKYSFNVARKGQTVYSNIPLVDFRVRRSGRPWNRTSYGFPWAQYLQDADDLMLVRSGHVFLDEIDMWFHAHDWNKIDFEARRFWTQHRKAGLNILLACVYIDGVAKVIRDIVGLRVTMVLKVAKWSIGKMTNAHTERSTRGSKSWVLLHADPHLYQLFSTAWVVGKGGSDASKMGEAATIYNDDRAYTVADSADDVLRYAADTVSTARPGLCPLIRPVVFRECRGFVHQWQDRPCSMRGADRVAAARLLPVLDRMEKIRRV